MSDFKPSSLKVTELRAELSKRGLPTKGKKDELVARLTEALGRENSSDGNEQLIDEPAEKQASVEQEKIVKKDSTNAIQTNDTVEITSESSAVIEQSTEQLIEKPLETVAKSVEPPIKKPADQIIKKPEEQLIERSAEEVVQVPIVTDIDQSSTKVNKEQALEKPQEGVIAKPQAQQVEKHQESLIEKPQEQLIEKPQEQVSEKPQEQVVQKPQEQLIEKQTQDMMDTEVDSGLKRKRLESDSKEDDDKRLKTDGNKHDSGDLTAIYVKGFIRPLIIKHVQELFGKYGTVKRFWMDSIKTHCYVTYETRLQSKDAFTKVDGIKFPADTGRVLRVGELTSDQADKLIEYEQNAAEKRIKVDWEDMISKVKAGEALSSAGSSSNDDGSRRFRSIGIGQITKQLAQAVEPINPPAAKLPPANTKPREISLDDLFRKTKSLPHLYYLPNTEQEAKIKLEKLQQQQ
ncbi:hypothetical protein BD408DRAFT_419865 [Parasitella parasitica]|nr:hypothetical protein BD408DRAFT_419865 [Parasitella parasitica]